ncbi:hypothetical protein SALWKB12_2081 [Snodgrassella communis]|jgi:hypothetical protein|nr:hypothetical protein SALWKB12_2081 [Snodgrassella communis]
MVLDEDVVHLYKFSSVDTEITKESKLAAQKAASFLLFNWPTLHS